MIVNGAAWSDPEALEPGLANRYVSAMSEPENLVLVLLRELRSEMNARFDHLEARMEARFATVDRRLDMMHRNGEKALRGFIGHRAMVERTMKQRIERLETVGS